MSPWLLGQIVYASFAWWFCARTVMRTARFGAVAGRELASTIRELHRASRRGDVPQLVTLLDAPVLGYLLDREDDHPLAAQLVNDANTVSQLAAPPVRLLRSLATVGTMLGLLAAVASLRAGLATGTTVSLQAAAARAFDSAVVGFVTALPCWTAISLVVRKARQTDHEIESVLVALTAEAAPTDPRPEGEAASTPGESEPVDGSRSGR